MNSLTKQIEPLLQKSTVFSSGLLAGYNRIKKLERVTIRHCGHPMTNDYNGFTGRQRDRKLRALHRPHAEGTYPGTGRPCDLCGDPDAVTAPHSEDYSEPFKWEPPHTFALCNRCHLHIHKRFNRPESWAEFVEHVKRGGYAREFPDVMKERKAYRKTMAQGESYHWKLIPGRKSRSGWWEKLNI